MLYLCSTVVKKLFSNLSQILIIFMLAVLTSGMFFFVRYSIDENEKNVKRYVSAQNQEDFRFTVDDGSNGKNNDVIASQLSDKYGFDFEKREYVKLEDSGFTFYIINLSKNINKIYIVDGSLPSSDNEVAFPYKYFELNGLNIGDKITISGKTYTLVGSVCMPDYIMFKPFDEQQKSYEDSSFVVMTDNELYNYKNGTEVAYYCGKTQNKSIEDIIGDLRNETGVNYVENAAVIESDSAPLIAFNSNKSLAYTFLAGLLIVSAFIYYLFITKFMQQNMKMLGSILAIGYKVRNVVSAMILLLFPLILVGSVLGCIIGGRLSSVLVNRYIDDYMFLGFDTGVSIKMLLLGTLALPIVDIILVSICGSVILSEDPAVLMRANKTAKESRLYNKFVSLLLVGVKNENKFSYKTILRKKNNIFLTIFALIGVGALFVTSISLYLSSTTAFKKQFEGLDYDYIYQTSNYIEGEVMTDCDTGLKVLGVVSDGEEDKNVDVYGLNNETKYYNLYSKNGNKINIEDDKVVISEGYSVLNNIEIGDTVDVKIDNNDYEFEVSEICQNGGLNSMYLKKDTLASIINISNTLSNIFFSKDKVAISDSKVTTKAEEIQAAEFNQSSNKSSAVINQVIGILFAILMFSLVIIMIVEENKDNIKILMLLGYTDKKAVKLVLSKYRIFICIITLITYPVALYISYLIHIIISKGTNDYICFSTNIFVFFALILVVNIVYTIIMQLFKHIIKVK